MNEDQRHAVGHAQYLVDRATPENPDVCFDYTLVQSLLMLIDRLRADNERLTAALEPYVKDGHCPTCDNAGDCNERQPNCAWAAAHAALDGEQTSPVSPLRCPHGNDLNGPTFPPCGCS
jgi:hypothetical protein